MATEENLKTLEALMTEFFHHATSNERKRQIEELLNSFSQQEDAWSLCLYFTKQTHNDYVVMYCTGVLENLINKQWHGINPENKRIIRETIVKILYESHKTTYPFVRNKLAKLNVDIARHDWPHFYHDFLSKTMEWAQSSVHAMLGVVLLQTTSEEMASPREDLSISRKQELQGLLLENMPQILSTLTAILDNVLDLHKWRPSTPTSSPTRSQPTISTPLQGSSSQNLVDKMFQSPENKPVRNYLVPFSKDTQDLCKQVLTCLGHLFSWIPLSTMITSHLLSTVFKFATFGCEKQFDSASSDNMQSLGMLAMCCINELLSKNCVPADFEDYILQLFQQTFYLLRKLISSPALNALDTDFIDKFTEFLRLFVNHHLRRFEGYSQFPVLEFLNLLYDYTFKQVHMESFYSCLEIWLIFIDYIKTKVEDRSSDSSSLDRYRDGLLGLVTATINRLQYKKNLELLKELDDEDRDDDGMTELECYYNHCNDVFMAIVEIMPNEATSILMPIFEENYTAYMKFEDFLASPQCTIQLPAYSLALKDLGSSLQTTSRLANSLTGAAFQERFEFTDKLIRSLVELAKLNTRLKLYSLNTNTCESTLKDLQPICIDLYGQTLATIKSYTPWLAQYYVESFHKGDERDKCAQIVTDIIQLLLPTLDKEVPAKIVDCTVHTLSAMLIVVRPVYLYELSSVQKLYDRLALDEYRSSFTPECEKVLVRSLSTYIILRWPALPDSEQKWDLRSANHASFIHAIHGKLLDLARNSQVLIGNPQSMIEGKKTVKQVLTSLQNLIDGIQDEPRRSKEIMYESIKEYIQVSLQVFSFFLEDSDVLDCVISFFLTLIGCLRMQLGIPFTETIMQTFLDMFTKQRLVEILQRENTTAYHIVESFLKMLELIVKEPGSGFRGLLPKIIHFCIQCVYPVVATKPTPDIKGPLYVLHFQLLINNWKYFYKSSVVRTFGAVDPSEPLEHQQEFTDIIHTFGQSFLQSDIAIFKHNLAALEQLNSKWKLYHKTIFLETMMSQFLTVLLQTLAAKSHDLLQEDIVVAVYNMASVDFNMFAQTFLPTFLKEVNTIDYHQKTTLLEKFQQSDQDLPTFISSIQRLVNDLRYYTIVNASLPPGTIDLNQSEPEPISEY